MTSSPDLPVNKDIDLPTSAENIKQKLRDALTQLDSWPDLIADADPTAYARNLLVVVERLHTFTAEARRTIAVGVVRAGHLSIRGTATALKVSPNAVKIWKDTPPAGLTKEGQGTYVPGLIEADAGHASILPR